MIHKLKHTAVNPTNIILSAQASLSVCKFSLHNPHKRSCLVKRIKQLIIHSNLSKIKDKILPTCFQGNYRDSLGEFSNTSSGMFGSKSVKLIIKIKAYIIPHVLLRWVEFCVIGSTTWFVQQPTTIARQSLT